jgi:tetratricopeptide (TPR) repeat protein
MNSFTRSRLARIGIAICIVFSGFYIHAVLRIWRADWLQDQHDERSLEASARLEPWDARTHRLLGRYLLNGVEDPAHALANLNRAVKLNPFEGRYWLDLAATYHVMNEVRESQEALEQALRAEPTSPSIAWESANFYLAQNDPTRALPLFRVAIQYGSEQTVAAALDLCWRATHSVSQVVNQALPTQPAPYFVFLTILTTRNEMASANELWHALAARNLRFPVENAFPYFDYLIANRQIDQAEEVWGYLGELDPELLGDTRLNLIANGGFEGNYLNGAFGWRHQPYSQVDVSLDTSNFHSGTRAVRLNFTGPALSDTGIYQFVPVRPNVRYRFSAFVKSEDIVSASGPRLVVQDFYNNQPLGSTDDLIGTTGWRQQVLDFVTGPQARLIVIKVMRVPGNPLIKGIFWLDDVILAPVAVPTTEHNH